MTTKTLADLMGTGGFYFNEALAEAYRTHNERSSPAITILERDLTWVGKPNQDSIEGKAGVTFDKLSAKNVIQRVSWGGWSWQAEDVAEEEEILEAAFEHFGRSLEGLTLDEYLDLGETVIQSLGFPYVRFDTDQVRAYMTIALDQKKTFDVDLHNIVLGNLGERAVQELLFGVGIEFVARSFLFHHSPQEQEEKDVTVFDDNITEDDKAVTLGVRCMEEFNGNYLYSGSRVVNARNKIAKYVVFCNHFGHHIVYVTGVVKKGFLVNRHSGKTNTMIEYPLLEHCDGELVVNTYAKRLNKLRLTSDDGQVSEKLRQILTQHFEKRMGFDTFVGRLRDYK